MALFRKPPTSGSRYDAEFIPRHSLLVSPSENIPVGTVIFDKTGNRFLCMPWATEHYRGQPLVTHMVLFEVTQDLLWVRPTDTVEPISGLAQPGEDEVLGIVPAAVDPFRRKTDALHIEQEIYKVMCVAPILVGDFLDKKRVRRVETSLGVTYAQVL